MANLWDLFPEEAGGPFEKVYRNAFYTQEAVQLEGRLKALGTWLEVHAYPSPDKLTIFFRDITEARRSREVIVRLAMTDARTGLSNRVVFRERLRETIASEPVAVIVIDIDTFKEVNDTHGHPVDDELLVCFGERVLACVGDALLARLGGDEFAVIVAGGRREAQAVAARVVRGTAEPYEISAGPLTCAPAWASQSHWRTTQTRTGSSRKPTSPCSARKLTIPAASASSRRTWRPNCFGHRH
jgi:GGDEF domain-containing protein